MQTQNTQVPLRNTAYAANPAFAVPPDGFSLLERPVRHRSVALKPPDKNQKTHQYSTLAAPRSAPGYPPEYAS